MGFFRRERWIRTPVGVLLTGWPDTGLVGQVAWILIWIVYAMWRIVVVCVVILVLLAIPFMVLLTAVALLSAVFG